MIPQSFVQDLLARIDIVEVVERAVTLKKSGANYFGRCPFHTEKSASFSVSPSKQFYYCFGCGANGTAIDFVMQYHGLSFPEAIAELARDVGLEVPNDHTGSHHKDEDFGQLSEALAKASRFYQTSLARSPHAKTYIQRRGLSPEVVERFSIGYAPDAWNPLATVFPDPRDSLPLKTGLLIEKEKGSRYDRFRDRIMFPIHDRRGRIIGFGGRILDKGEPKYLNSPETRLFEKGRELYGLFLAGRAIRDAGFALVVEGYMDVVALAQFGLENAVATLGTATTPHHIQALLRQTNRIVFCFDGDAAGRRAAWRALENALEALRDDVTLAFLFLPPEHDPDTFVREHGAKAMREAAHSATPLATFLLDTLRARCGDLASAEGRAHLVYEAKPLITRIPNAAGVLRLQLIKAIASISKLSQSELEQALGIQSATRDHASTKTMPGRSHAPRPRAPRVAPSGAAALLRLVLQSPLLAARLPVNLIPDDTPEGRALIAIVDMANLDEPLGTMAGLLERFRDTPHGATLISIYNDPLEAEFNTTVIEPLFEDALKRLQTVAISREIEEFMEQARTSGLSPVEQQRLSSLLREKNVLSTLPRPNKT